MAGILNFNISDLLQNPGALSEAFQAFAPNKAPMQVPVGAQPTVPPGILNSPQTEMPSPSQPAQDAQVGQGIMDKIGSAFAINRDNFGNRIGNGLIAAGSPDAAGAFAKLEAADEAGKIKYNQISGTPYFWYYTPQGQMAVVDAQGNKIQAGALEGYLKKKAEDEANLWRQKEQFKGEVQTNVAAQKEANKVGLEQASDTAAAQGQANQLRAIASELGGTAGDVAPATGKVAGAVSAVLPNAVGSMVMPQSTKLRQDAERIIQNSLRATLGAQFTEKEGTRFLERAYNPALPVADNVSRLNAMADELEAVAKNKTAAVEYMKKNGTLAGFDPTVITPQAGGGNMTRVNSEQEWAALPPGTQYIGPDGKTRTKR